MIIRYFQEQNIKVFMFLQKMYQREDGFLKLQYEQETPPFFEKPGTIAKFDEKGKQVSKKSGDVENGRLFYLSKCSSFNERKI